MSVHPCCEVRQGGFEGKLAKMRRRDGNQERQSSFLRRLLDFSGWLLPGAALALLPKCPLCLAAYIALGTGIGLSVSGAMYLRALLILLCVITLLYVATRQVNRFTAKFH